MWDNNRSVHPMKIKESIKEHKNALANRERTYKELSKRGRRIGYFGILLFISSFLFIPLGYLIPPEIATRMWVLMFGIGLLLVFIGQLVIKLKGVPSTYFSPDDEIFLKAFDALTFLETYMRDNLELAKHQCLNELHETNRLMKYYWKPSEIEVVMKEIGNEIETFKEKFEEDLIYTSRYGTKKEGFQTVFDLLTEFAEYLIDPSKEKLIHLNQNIDLNQKKGSLLHSKKARPSYRVIDFFKRHQIHKHVAFVTLFFAFGFFPALFGIYFSDISINTAYMLFAAIFGPSIGGYIIYLLKRE